jgi:CRP-like cAMP-binding protein
MREFPGAHPLMAQEEQLIAEAAECSELVQLGFDDLLIGMGREDCQLFLIVSGALDVIVDGQEVVRRVTGETVGELERVSPHIKRAATVVARDQSIVRSISETDFAKLANRFPVLWRNIARSLVSRLIGKITQ